jgi:hypothetical protein
VKTKLPAPEIMTRKGKAVSVILPIKIYQKCSNDWKMPMTSTGSRGPEKATVFP